MQGAFRVMHGLNRFMRLPEAERWLIAEANLYLLCAKLAILTASARTMMALGHLDARLSSPNLQIAVLPAEIIGAVSALDKSSHHPFFANCLVRAVALRMFLARREIPTEMHIGARKDEHGQFAAHAWLTYEGTILIGGGDAGHLYRELVGSSHTLLQ